ncbi:hypothetical protein D3C74_288920 [compost metagenome]
MQAGIRTGKTIRLNSISPTMTTIAISISDNTPEGINAAKVPLNIIAAEITTPPICRAEVVILTSGVPSYWHSSLEIMPLLLPQAPVLHDF